MYFEDLDDLLSFWNFWQAPKIDEQLKEAETPWNDGERFIELTYWKLCSICLGKNTRSDLKDPARPCQTLHHKYTGLRLK